jgi:hypothetical protein
MARVNKIFSAGLGPGGRAAAWAVAFAGAGLWYYAENRGNGDVFSIADQKEWNEKRKSEQAKKSDISK